MSSDPVCLQKALDQAAAELREADPTISLISGTELFLRFVTRSAGTYADFEEHRGILLGRAQKFVERTLVSRAAIGKLFVDRILRDGQSILVHGLSRVVLEVLRQASGRGKRLHVYCTECRTPTRVFGQEMADMIAKATGFQVSLVVDSSVARIMHEMDFIVFGAEGIVENGGVINTVGTYQIAMIANLLRVPVYVAAESFKFVRHFPLSQNGTKALCVVDESSLSHFSFFPDVPQVAVVQIRDELAAIEKSSEQLKVVRHTHDYCPPNFITLLFTDSGILTPAAVSDTLIRLYL